MRKKYLTRKIYFKIIKPASVLLLLVFVVGGMWFALWGRNIDRVELYAKYARPIQFVQKLSNILYLPKQFSESKLESYELVIAEEDWNFLDENLPEIYKGNILTDKYKKEVPAVFKAGEKEYEVEVRYRGDTDGHWRDKKKSWFITFHKNDLFEGKRKIHLVIPVDRKYLIEELNFYRARKAGLVVPRTKFVNLFVNGKRQGVYWEFEHWRTEFLEGNNIPATANLYGAIDFPPFGDRNIDIFSTEHGWRKYSKSEVSELDNASDLSRLLEIIHHTSDNYFNSHIADIIDMENFYAWQINQMLMESSHQSGMNMRFYFDPILGKFRFIPWDVSIGNEDVPALYEKDYNTLITRVLKNPKFLHERNILLWKYVKDDAQLEDDLTHFDYLDEQTKNDFYKDGNKTASHRAYREDIEQYRDSIERKYLKQRDNLKNANSIVTVVPNKDKTSAEILVATTGFSAIEVVDISLKLESCDKSILLENIKMNCSDGTYQTTLNKILYSVKEKETPYLKPGYNSIILKLESRTPIVLSNRSIELNINNAITGDKIPSVILNVP